MITAHNPWSHASTSDPNFANFLIYPGSIRIGLPISQEATEVISRILAFIPSARPTLTDMYDKVLQISNFFMTDAEIVEGSEIVREIVAQTQAQAVAHDEGHTDADIIILVEGEPMPEYADSAPDFGSTGRRSEPSSASNSTGPVTPNTQPSPSSRSAGKVSTDHQEARSSSVFVADSTISFNVALPEDSARYLARDVPPAPRAPRHQGPRQAHSKKHQRQVCRSFSVELTEMLESILLSDIGLVGP